MKPVFSSKLNQTGFSLIELAVSIIIIALLTAGIVGGSQLVKQSELSKVIADANEIYASISSFKQQYDYFPGDMPDASVYWSGAVNGGGDGNVDLGADTAGAGASETSRVFQHMSLAGVYEGSFTPGNTMATSGSGTPEMAPQSIRKSRFIITDYTEPGCCTMVNRNHIGGNSINVIRPGLSTSTVAHANTHVGYGFLTVQEVYSIDSKIDDGNARMGRFTGHNAYISGETNGEACLVFATASTHDASLPGGGASYNLNSDFKCNFSLDLDF